VFEGTNQITLEGKITRVMPLRYTPSGLPVLEFAVAFPQFHLGRKSVGSVGAVVTGDRAEGGSRDFRIGRKIRIDGHLWKREYRDRSGRRAEEVKIVVERIGGTDEKS